jgi:hypothetical protein
MSEERRFKVTVTLVAEDLMSTAQDDEGSSVVIVQNTVGAATRHEMEKRLSATMVKMGDDAQADKSGRKS